MSLKRRVTVSEWVDIERIDGRVLLRPRTGRLQAQFEKRIGLTPHGLRREKTGTNPDGTDAYSDFVQFSADPEQAYEARVWYVRQLVEDVDAQYDDGTDIKPTLEFMVPDREPVVSNPCPGQGRSMGETAMIR